MKNNDIQHIIEDHQFLPRPQIISMSDSTEHPSKKAKLHHDESIDTEDESSKHEDFLRHWNEVDLHDS